MGIFLFNCINKNTPQKKANLPISNKAAASREDSIDEIARNEAPVGEPPNDLKGVGEPQENGDDLWVISPQEVVSSPDVICKGICLKQQFWGLKPPMFDAE